MHSNIMHSVAQGFLGKGEGCVTYVYTVLKSTFRIVILAYVLADTRKSMTQHLDFGKVAERKEQTNVV